MKPGTIIGQASVSVSNRHVVIGAGRTLGGGIGISLGFSLGLSGRSSLSLNPRHRQGESCRNR